MWLTINVIPMSMNAPTLANPLIEIKKKTHNDEDSPSLLNYGGTLIFFV